MCRIKLKAQEFGGEQGEKGSGGGERGEVTLENYGEWWNLGGISAVLSR